MNQKIMEDDFDEVAHYGAPKQAHFHEPAVQPRRTMQPSGNPLAAYFRLPGLSVQLPTNGAFFPQGAVTFNNMGEVAVYPMRAADELLLKSPDALMSGFAIEKMLESCIPDIKNPKLISAPDLDVLLLAVRASTFGDNMDVEVTCPSCGHEHSFACHLPSLLQNMTFVGPEDLTLRLSDEVVVYLRPYNIDNATRMSLATFEETRRMQILDADKESTPEVKQAELNKSYERITALNMEMVADCILRVVVPTGEVTDKRQILEFVNNISRAWFNQIDSKLKDANLVGIDRKVDVKCDSCGHEWKTEVEFNPVNFSE